MHDPIADFGQICLYLTLIAAVYAAVVSVAGARRGSAALVLSGERATYAVAALTTLASVVMVYAFVSHDFAIRFVAHYSDSRMPLFYKVTAYWGGLDGSMLFWVFLLAVFGGVAVYVNRQKHRDLLPYVIATLMAVMTFFLVVLLFAKDPFDTFLANAPVEGKGLAPLLQNFYMVFHPPSLYTGLVGMTVPYAFCMAALVTGNLDDAWLYSVRRWVIVAWFFLSLGLVLGMLWAYEVLGWGGFWGWDPVENAGFLAWLTSTAFLHSIMIQERRGMLKVWNVSLMVVTFTLTIVATFLTRSGIVQSVHAFGYDPQLKVLFLLFIGLILLVSFAFVIYRLPQLRARAGLDSFLSREFAFVVNNFLLLVGAIGVLYGTLLPTLSEATSGVRKTVDAAGFDKFMGPFGLIILFLTGVGPLIAWRKATAQNLKEQFLIPGLVFLVTVLGLALFVPASRQLDPAFSDYVQLPMPLLCFGLCAFVGASLAQEFVRGTSVRKRQSGTDAFTALVGLVLRGQRRYGGYIVHLGVVLMFLGFAGVAYRSQTDVTLEQGRGVHLADGLTVRFDSLSEVNGLGRSDLVAHISVLDRAGNLVHEMTPARWVFPGHESEPVTHVDIWRRLEGDLYLTPVLLDPSRNVANLRVTVNPLTDWVWFGFMVLFLGTAVCLAPERLLEVAGVRIPAAVVAAGVALVIISGASVARAQGSPTAQEPAGHVASTEVWAEPPTPTEQGLFRKLVCLCGCGRQTIGDCNCQQAAKARDEVRALLRSGKTPQQVLDIFAARYGHEVLEDQHVRSAVVVPFVSFAAGALLLAGLARRWVKRSRAVTHAERAAEPPATATDADARDALDEQLEDELRKLD